VNGDELLFDNADVRVRGDGVNGIRPPAVRVEKSPAWDFMGVDTAVAIVAISGMISVERQINVSIDDKRFGISNELQESQPNGSWMGWLVFSYLCSIYRSAFLKKHYSRRRSTAASRKI
jgi:hypothetical protein